VKKSAFTYDNYDESFGKDEEDNEYYDENKEEE
jgi:hypothetical protein